LGGVAITLCSDEGAENVIANLLLYDSLVKGSPSHRHREIPPSKVQFLLDPSKALARLCKNLFCPSECEAFIVESGVHPFGSRPFGTPFRRLCCT
jgi:hypothetical protein